MIDPGLRAMKTKRILVVDVEAGVWTVPSLRGELVARDTRDHRRRLPPATRHDFEYEINALAKNVSTDGPFNPARSLTRLRANPLAPLRRRETHFGRGRRSERA